MVIFSGIEITIQGTSYGESRIKVQVQRGKKDNVKVPSVKDKLVHVFFKCLIGVKLVSNHCDIYFPLDRVIKVI